MLSSLPVSCLAGSGRGSNTRLWCLQSWPSWPYRAWPTCRPSGRSLESSATCLRRNCWTGSRTTPVLVSEVACFHGNSENDNPDYSAQYELDNHIKLQVHDELLQYSAPRAELLVPLYILVLTLNIRNTSTVTTG